MMYDSDCEKYDLDSIYGGCRQNIFHCNGFKYTSRNGKYSSRLSGYQTGDTVVMICNSDFEQYYYFNCSKRIKN